MACFHTRARQEDTNQGERGEVGERDSPAPAFHAAGNTEKEQEYMNPQALRGVLGDSEWGPWDDKAGGKAETEIQAWEGVGARVLLPYHLVTAGSAEALGRTRARRQGEGKAGTSTLPAGQRRCSGADSPPALQYRSVSMDTHRADGTTSSRNGRCVSLVDNSKMRVSR